MGTIVLQIMPKEIIGDDESIASVFPSLGAGTTIAQKEYTYGKGDKFVDPEYKNAVGDPQAVYVRAQAVYNQKLGLWQQAQDNTQKALTALNAIRNYYKPIEKNVNDNSWWPVYDFVLGSEGFGDNAYANSRNNTFKKWASLGFDNVDMRKKTEACAALTDANWSYIFSDEGLRTGTERYLSCQRDIISQWFSKARDVEGKLQTAYNNAVQSQDEAKKAVDNAKTELNKAIAAEEKASGQRIKEKEVDPEYVRLKLEGERVKAEYAYKRQRNQMIVAGVVGAGILSIGVLYLLKK